jgi:hypothetical protein
MRMKATKLPTNAAEMQILMVVDGAIMLRKTAGNGRKNAGHGGKDACSGVE